MWAQIDTEYEGFAWKRISEHEIGKNKAKGHEFQGINALLGLLGDCEREVPTDYYLFEDDDDGNPSLITILSGSSKWYDARREQPLRAPEWRLYYPSATNELQKRYQAGDLLIVGMRKEGSLALMLVPQSSVCETALKSVLGIGRLKENGRGSTKWIESVSGDVGVNAAEVLEQLQFSYLNLISPTAKPPLPFPRFDFGKNATVEKITSEMLERWPQNLGPCSEVIGLLKNSDHTDFSSADLKDDPDSVLEEWLELAEATYREWEKQVLGNYLESIRADPEIRPFAKSFCRYSEKMAQTDFKVFGASSSV